MRLCEGVEGGPDATSAPRAAVIVPEDEAAGLEHVHGESRIALDIRACVRAIDEDEVVESLVWRDIEGFAIAKELSDLRLDVCT